MEQAVTARETPPTPELARRVCSCGCPRYLPAGAPPDRMYATAACRVRAHRARKRAARPRPLPVHVPLQPGRLYRRRYLAVLALRLVLVLLAAGVLAGGVGLAVGVAAAPLTAVVPLSTVAGLVVGWKASAWLRAL